MPEAAPRASESCVGLRPWQRFVEQIGATRNASPPPHTNTLSLSNFYNGLCSPLQVASVSSIAHFKERVESVKKGSECGIALEGVASYEVGDQIVAVKITKSKQKLEVRYDYDAASPSKRTSAASGSSIVSGSGTRAGSNSGSGTARPPLAAPAPRATRDSDSSQDSQGRRGSHANSRR